MSLNAGQGQKNTIIVWNGIRDIPAKVLVLNDFDTQVVLTPVQFTGGIFGATGLPLDDPESNALAGLTSGPDLVPYFTGVGTAATAAFTPFGRSLVDDTKAYNALNTLELLRFLKTNTWKTDVGNIEAPMGLGIFGGFATSFFEIANSGNLANYQHTVLFDATGGSIAMNMPPAPIHGQEHDFVRFDNSGNTVTLNGYIDNLGSVTNFAMGTRSTLTLKWSTNSGTWRIIRKGAL